MKLNRKHLEKLMQERNLMDKELAAGVAYVHHQGNRQLCVVVIGSGFRRRYCVMRTGRRGYLIPESELFVLRQSAISKLLQMMDFNESVIGAMPVGAMQCSASEAN